MLDFEEQEGREEREGGAYLVRCSVLGAGEGRRHSTPRIQEGREEGEEVNGDGGGGGAGG